MIIVDKILKFVLTNDYYNYDTLEILNAIYQNLEKYNLARELVLKLEKFLVTNKFLNINDLVKKKINKDTNELFEILKLAVCEDLKVDISILEQILQQFVNDRNIFKYALGLLCRSSEKYISMALKHVKNDPDIALFGLAISNEKQAVPVILKNINLTENDTFRECIKAIIELEQDQHIIKILKSDVDVSKKILILNIIQGLNIDNLKDSMLKFARDNMAIQPSIAINSLKNVKKISTEEDINSIIFLYEQLPAIYKNIVSDVFMNLTSDEGKLEKYILTLLSKNLIKRAVTFLKSLKVDDIRSAIGKAIRVENSIEEINVITNFINENFEKHGPNILLLRYLTRIDDKDLKFLAVQLILEGGYSKQLMNFEVDDELLITFIKLMTNKRYSDASKTISFYTLDGNKTIVTESLNFFRELKIKNHFTDVVENLIEKKFFDAEFIKTIGYVKLDDGIEYFRTARGHVNEVDTVSACLFAYRYYPAGQVYEEIKEYINSSNPKLVATTLDTLVYLRYEPVKEIYGNFLDNSDKDVQFAAIKGVVKFNLPLMDKIVDILNNYDDNELGEFFKGLQNIFSPTLLEVLIYHFTQVEYSSETAKHFFNYIKRYPNKEMIINKLNSVMKAI